MSGWSDLWDKNVEVYRTTFSTFDEGKLYPLQQKFNINIQTTCTATSLLPPPPEILALIFTILSQWKLQPYPEKKKQIHPFSILQSPRWLFHFFAMFVFILTISVWLSAFFYWSYTLVWLLFILLTFFMGFKFCGHEKRKKNPPKWKKIFLTHIRTKYFAVAFFMDEWNKGKQILFRYGWTE